MAGRLSVGLMSGPPVNHPTVFLLLHESNMLIRRCVGHVFVCVGNSFTDVHGASLPCFYLGTEGLQIVPSIWLIPDAGACDQCTAEHVYVYARLSSHITCCNDGRMQVTSSTRP